MMESDETYAGFFGQGLNQIPASQQNRTTSALLLAYKSGCNKGISEVLKDKTTSARYAGASETWEDKSPI